MLASLSFFLRKSAIYNSSNLIINLVNLKIEKKVGFLEKFWLVFWVRIGSDFGQFIVVDDTASLGSLIGANPEFSFLAVFPASSIELLNGIDFTLFITLAVVDVENGLIAEL